MAASLDAVANFSQAKCDKKHQEEVQFHPILDLASGFWNYLSLARLRCHSRDTLRTVASSSGE